MSSERCTMEKITYVCRRHPIDKILDSGNLIMKTFQNKMSQNFRIVHRFKEDIFVMVNTNFNYIQEVEPRKIFLDPLGYELSDDTMVGFIDLVLKSQKDQEEYKFRAYDEITQ